MTYLQICLRKIHPQTQISAPLILVSPFQLGKHKYLKKHLKIVSIIGHFRRQVAAVVENYLCLIAMLDPNYFDYTKIFQDPLMKHQSIQNRVDQVSNADAE